MSNKVKLSQLCIIEVNKKPIGEMNFRIDNGFAEIGIKICVLDYEGKGYGTILLKMLIEFLFCDSQINSKTKIDKIILDTNLAN